MNLASNLARTAESTPAAPAITFDETVVPYGMLAQGAARVAGWLQDLGVQPGDRVAVSMPNIPHMPIVYYGILWAGGVVVPMNPLYKSREVAFVLSDSGARALFAWDGVAEEAGKGAAEAGAEFISVIPAEFLGQVMAHEPVALVERDDEDTAVVLYTSGTTGTPKGAELTHTNMARNAEISVGLVDVGPDDVVFGGLPLFHSFGQTVGMNAAISVGANLTLIPRFEPTKALEVLQRDKVTILLAVPTMYVALLQHPNRATTTCPRCASAPRAAPRCPSRSCMGSSPPSTRSSSRGTACPRPARSPRSTTPTASASPVRSARRSTVWRCASSTRTGTTRPRARSARSRSRATT